MRTLVIHPSDRTTDFLDEIYKDTDALVIRGNVRYSYMQHEMRMADRILMMGHGTPQGLLGHNRLIIDQDLIPLLRTKRNLVGIWCNADGFFERYGLNGLYTGMIVSEMQEAQIFNIDCTINQVYDSNTQFAKAVRRGLELFDPEFAAPQVREFYTEKPTSYWTRGNPVIDYNVQNIYDSRIKSTTEVNSDVDTRDEVQSVARTH